MTQHVNHRASDEIAQLRTEVANAKHHAAARLTALRETESELRAASARAEAAEQQVERLTRERDFETKFKNIFAKQRDSAERKLAMAVEMLKEILTYPREGEEVPSSHRSYYLLTCVQDIARATLAELEKADD